MSQSPPTLAGRLLAGLGRRLRPLLNPDADAERARFEKFAREQRDVNEVLQRRASSQSERLTEVYREVEVLRKHTSGLRSRLTRQLQFSERVLKRVSDRNVELNEERVLDRLARAGRSSGAVIVGPWTGEVGFELIYWVPFVRWALGHAGIDPARVTVISRGGTAPWYDGLASRYVDALDLATPEEFRRRTTENPKQRVMGTFDRDLLRRAVQGTGPGAVSIIHPGMMYALLYPYWRRDASIARLDAYTRYRRYEPLPAVDAGVTLPPTYTAVRFYFSQCFPDTPENRAFVATTIRSLAASTDVVVLSAGVGLDDHSDAGAERGHRVHLVDAGLHPSANLAIQTAVISRASAFVGTYGGFSYLAPLYGVDTVAFHAESNFQTTHLHAAQHALELVDGGALVPLSVHQAGLLRGILGAPSHPTSRLP